MSVCVCAPISLAPHVTPSVSAFLLLSLTHGCFSVDIALVPSAADASAALPAPASKRVTFSLTEVNDLLARLQARLPHAA